MLRLTPEDLKAIAENPSAESTLQGRTEHDAREARALRELVSEFRATLHDEYSMLTPPDSAPCQASVMWGGRCRCSECRLSRYLTLEATAEALGITR